MSMIYLPMMSASLKLAIDFACTVDRRRAHGGSRR